MAKTTLAKIDEALKTWQANLSTARANILALDDLPACKFVRNSQDIPALNLTGRSSEEVKAALAAFDELCRAMPRLQATIDKAAELRENLPAILGLDHKLDEIYELIWGNSVELPPVKVPLDQRGLLTPAELTSKITPQRLLDAMLQAFDVASKALNAVQDALEQVLPALKKSRERITALRTQAINNGITQLPELDMVQEKIDEISNRFASDPLSVKATYDSELEPLLQAAERRIGEWIKLKEDVRSALQSAQAKLVALTGLSHNCDAAWQKCLEDIQDPLPSPRHPQLLTRLTDWLPRIQSTFDGGNFTAANIGLTNWKTVADQMCSFEQAALDAYTAMTDKRMELRGLLSTYIARAARVKVVEDGALNELAKQAEFLLYHPQKTPLAEAERLVNEYGCRVRELAASL